ncbi:EF hand domain-containing protein [Phthorimaea operculella]|nr:EF hand domain-containing protein [Phthorimaea operculella]
MLECLIKARCDGGGRIIPAHQPTMTRVGSGSGSPVDDNCLVDMDACYETFDKDGDGKLNMDEFRLICKALFRNDKGHIYPVSEERARHMFNVFDRDGDGYIDKEEFTFCWNHWIKVVSM